VRTFAGIFKGLLRVLFLLLSRLPRMCEFLIGAVDRRRGFSLVAGRFDDTGAFLLIGSLMIGAGVALGFFDIDSHQRRLHALDEGADRI
jgi:hypothetical protein